MILPSSFLKKVTHIAEAISVSGCKTVNMMQVICLFGSASLAYIIDCEEQFENWRTVKMRRWCKENVHRLELASVL